MDNSIINNPYRDRVDTPKYEYYFDKNGSISKFIKLLEERGFIVQKGSISYIDILKLASEGKVDTCFGNNAGVPYAVYILPPAPNQDPCQGQKPPKGYDPCNPCNYPPNICYAAPGIDYKLRPDESIVLIGQTPPPVVYFGFRSYVGFIENKRNKDYSNAVTAGNNRTGFYHFIGASLGDQISNSFIWTDSTPYGTPGKPFGGSTVIITTADRGINQQMRDALTESGFNPGIMNDDNIPINLVNMGLEKGKDTFQFVMRAAIFEDPEIGWDYIFNLDKYFTVLRITPEKPLPTDKPWAIPGFKRRETGTIEFQVVPTARETLDYLRNQIIRKYGSPEYEAVDLELNPWEIDGYESILQDRNALIDDKDTLYYRTESFQLATDDDFVILYGVNHTQTGYATYLANSFYGEELLNGVVAARMTNELQYPADEYFPKHHKNSKYYYVVKMARNSKEGNEVIIPYSTDNPQGSAFGVDNNQNAFIGFRAYVNQKTQVASPLYDVIWGHAILFTKRKSPCQDPQNESF
jgi:hypothetical protein